MSARAKRRRRTSPPLARETAVVWAGVLWGASWALLTLATPLALLGLAVEALAWATVLAYGLLAGSALSLLAMALVTLPRDEAYDWDADVGILPPTLRAPVTVGAAIGRAIVGVFDVLAILSLTPNIVSESARFSMALTAVLGSLITILTAPLGVWTTILLCVWGVVLAVLLARGCYGLVVAIVGMFRQPRNTKPKERGETAV